MHRDVLLGWLAAGVPGQDGPQDSDTQENQAGPQEDPGTVLLKDGHHPAEGVDRPVSPSLPGTVGTFLIGGRVLPPALRTLTAAQYCHLFLHEMPSFY